MSIRKTLKSSRREHWKDAFIYLILTMIGNLAPFWVSFSLSLLIGQWTGWLGFFRHGEFYIYSASILTSILYLVVYKSSQKYKMTNVLLLVLVAISAVLFAGVTIEGILSTLSIPIPINVGFLFFSSFIIFLISVFLFFSLNLFENIRTSPDYAKIEKISYTNLENRLDNLREEPKNGN